MQIFIFERALLSQIKLYFHVCLWTTIGLQIVLVSQTSVTMNSTNPLHLALGGTVATITVRENNEPKIAILYLFVVLVPLTASGDIDMFCCLAPCSREALIMRFNLWNSWSLLSWGEATKPPQKTTISRSTTECGADQLSAAIGVTALALVHLCERLVRSRRGWSLRARSSIRSFVKVGVTGSIFTTEQVRRNYFCFTACKYEYCWIPDVLKRWRRDGFDIYRSRYFGGGGEQQLVRYSFWGVFFFSFFFFCSCFEWCGSLLLA